MGVTKIIAPDGQEIAFYSTNNTYKGSVYMNGATLTLSGQGTDISVSTGNNLIFKGSNHTIGGVNTILNIGRSGDTVDLSVTGVTYHLPSISTLSDVNLGTLTNGDLLKYDSTSGKFINTSSSSMSNLTLSQEGFSLTLNHPTSGGNAGIKINSKANAGSDAGFLIYQDDSAFSGDGTGTENSRLTLGVFNDFASTSTRDELWLQGGGRLVLNTGAWDSELNTIIGTPNSGTTGGYEFRVGNTIKMVLTDSGNLGIGTTNPGSLLQVDGGDIKIAQTATQTATTLSSYANATSFWIIQPTPKLVIGDSQSWDRGVSIIYSAGTTGGSAGILTIGQQDKVNTNYTHGVTAFFTNGTEKVRIDSSGNFGIGLTNPANKLDVSGDIHTSSSYIGPSLRFDAADGNGVRFWDSDNYKIWMSGATNGTWGGRISGETTSDYNMYFKMAGGGTNRGFNFISGSTVLFGVQPNGVRSSVQIISKVASGTAPFVVDSNTVVANLNASLLEGNSASAFATATHNHDTAYAKLDANGGLNVNNKYSVQYNSTDDSLDFIYVG